jgi:hypothetical protein
MVVSCLRDSSILVLVFLCGLSIVQSISLVSNLAQQVNQQAGRNLSSSIPSASPPSRLLPVGNLFVVISATP